MSDLYNLIFFPTVKAGEDEAEVRSKLSAKLKVDAGKVDQWFETGTPTLLLKEVAADVADRYMQAILDCGGNCNMQPSGGDSKTSLSLQPKPTNVELFVCPNCEHEIELDPGQVIEQCPACDLVLAKWEERQEEERKKEEIRRRLLRDARFQNEAQSEEQRKKDELAELKRLEAEIMKELGIKPPSKFWQMFSQRPLSFSISGGILLVAVSSLISFYVSDFLDSQAKEAVASEPASEEIQAISPMLVDSVGLQLSGNQAVVDELAAATQLLSGQNFDAKGLTKAAEQMMKGAGNEGFIQQANATSALKTTTPGGLGEPAPVAVNRNTLGGVSGLPGIDEIPEEMRSEFRQGELTHGQESVIDVLSHQMQLPDPKNPNGADILVDKIDKLDGSALADLMKSLSRDLEWDRYLLSHVYDYLSIGRMDQAGELTNVINNPSVKIEGLLAEIDHLVQKDPDADLKFLIARFSIELNKIEGKALRARFWTRLATLLTQAGVADEPYTTLERVESIADDEGDPGVKAAVLAQLAVAQLETINVSKAQILFKQAMVEASKASTVADRIAAFGMIARRYYDARNLTIASEILSEAQVLAATELKTYERAPALTSIAAAQLYMGDLNGALQSVRNAASGSAREAILVELTSWMIDEGNLFVAQSLIQSLRKSESTYKMAIRLIGKIANEGDERKARAMLSEYSPEPSRISDPSERALILSQFARLHLRLRQPDSADQMFREAYSISDQLSGRKAAVTRGMIALDQARGLWVSQAKEAILDVTESIVAEPISSEITATERVIKNLLPES